MTTLNVLHEPNPQLRQVSQDVSTDMIGTTQLKEFIEQMKVTMNDERGIGIAAPQVGKLWRVILVDRGNDVMALVNPIIERVSETVAAGEEGCLSVPGVWGIVERPTHIRFRATTVLGKSIELKAAHLFARVVQHEIDHLNGILFIDKATKIYRVDQHNKDKRSSAL